MKNQPTILNLVPDTYAFCTCKQSSKFPFCDGSHVSTNKKPVIEKVIEGTTKYICACGKSNNAPFCDGSHNK